MDIWPCLFPRRPFLLNFQISTCTFEYVRNPSPVARQESAPGICAETMCFSFASTMSLNSTYPGLLPLRLRSARNFSDSAWQGGVLITVSIALIFDIGRSERVASRLISSSAEAYRRKRECRSHSRRGKRRSRYTKYRRLGMTWPTLSSHGNV